MKQVIPTTKKRLRREDGLYGVPTDEYTVYMYLVSDYTSGIARLVDDVSLHKISNRDAFTIKKKRRMKMKIRSIEDYFVSKFNEAQEQLEELKA